MAKSKKRKKKKQKLNVKMIALIASSALVLAIVVGGLVTYQYVARNSRNIRAGDQAFAEGKFNQARKYYGRVVYREPDNAAVIAGETAGRFFPRSGDGVYGATKEPVHIAIKVETHNHPTGISPYEGAATGSGGEIRDCSATGRVARPKAGFMGLCLSHLRLTEDLESWETNPNKPDFLSSPMEIIRDAPLGSAAYNNYKQKIISAPGLLSHFWGSGDHEGP